MITQEPPLSAAETKKHLDELNAVIRRSLETATERARDYFESNRLPSEQILYAALVRFHVLRELDQLSKELGFKVVQSANLGVRIWFNGFDIRVWKTKEAGVLPPPGTTGRRQQFYRQETRLLPFAEEDLELFRQAHLAYLWTADGDLGLDELHLVCPSGVGDPMKAGFHHWCEPIPFVPSAEAETDVRIIVEELDDLALELRKVENSGADDDDRK